MEKPVDDTDYVKAHCERAWKLLKTIQTELQSIPGVSPFEPSVNRGSNINDENSDVNGTLSQILHEHEKRLKAELQFIQETELKSMPENANLQKLIIEQDQVKRLDHLKDTLTYLRAKRSEVLEDIKQEEETFSSYGSLNSSLKIKIAAMEQHKTAERESRALESVLAGISEKVKKISTRNHHLKNILKDILHKHFPLPEVKVPKQPLDESKDIDIDNLLPLKTIVGKLIEQSLNSPEQPYIEIDERFWPPHIEFLLRCQIVVKAPQNSHRIKLVPFHL